MLRNLKKQTNKQTTNDRRNNDKYNDRKSFSTLSCYKLIHVLTKQELAPLLKQNKTKP